MALPDLPEYRKFNGKLTSGIWEPHTFEVLARNLDSRKPSMSTLGVDRGHALLGKRHLQAGDRLRARSPVL